MCKRPLIPQGLPPNNLIGMAGMDIKVLKDSLDLDRDQASARLKEKNKAAAREHLLKISLALASRVSSVDRGR